MKKILLASLCFSLTTLSLGSHARSKNPTPATDSFTTDIFNGQLAQALQKIDQQHFNPGTKSFLRGYLQFQSGDFAAAATTLGASEKSPLEDYRLYFLALSQRAAGNPSAALENLQKAQAATSNSDLQTKIAHELAVTRCQAGPAESATADLDNLIAQSSSDLARYSLRIEKAECLEQKGQGRLAAQNYREIYLQFPEGDRSSAILEKIKKLAPEILTLADHSSRADILVQRSQFTAASLDFRELLRRQNPVPLDLRLRAADAFFKSRAYSEAGEQFQQIRQISPEALTSEDKVRLAQSFGRSNQFDTAIRTYQDLIPTVAPAEQAEFRYRVAFLLYDRGDAKAARAEFRKLLADNPEHPQKSNILWYLAWGLYVDQSYAEAKADFERLRAELPNSENAKRAAYWLARIAEKQGGKAKAKPLYEKIVEQDRFGYYGFLSLKHLTGKTAPNLFPHHGWTQELPKLALPKALAWKSLGGPGNERLQALLHLGIWDGLLAELNRPDTPASWQPLKTALDRALQENTPFSEENWTRKYPAPYAELVRLFSEMRGFPKHLAWAIMREESGFKPAVVSPAGAIGLMQIIPPTGERIAEELGRAFTPERLYHPPTNVEFGIHYLNRNLLKFDGDLPRTIASYNAGPEAVERWTKARPTRDWEEFVEEIPFRETNLYVKKVLRSYYIYRLMYPSS